MSEKTIPIAHVHLTSDEIDAVVDVLRSGNLRQGKKTAAFEQAFAKAVGAREAVAVSSGTAALHVAYLSTIGEGDEVLVPAFSHISTASMVHFSGGVPVFCDIDPRTYTMDVEDAAARITEKTRAIAPVHLYGNACDVLAVQTLCRERDLVVIWDAAQAHGTRHRGQDIGSLGDLVCYSFYPTKNMITGEGGMITTNSPELAQACRLLRSHGQTEKYYHPQLGLNYRMTDIAAAIGLGQLQKLPEYIRARRANAERLTASLSEVPGLTTPYVAPEVEHSFHQYTLRVDPNVMGVSRDEFADALRNERLGIGIHYPRPLHLQPAFDGIAKSVRLPVCEECSDTVLSIPVHPFVSESDLDRVIEAIKSVAGRIGLA